MSELSLLSGGKPDLTIATADFEFDPNRTSDPWTSAENCLRSGSASGRDWEYEAA